MCKWYHAKFQVEYALLKNWVCMTFRLSSKICSSCSWQNLPGITCMFCVYTSYLMSDFLRCAHYKVVCQRVLWYHPRLISERLPVRFRLGAQKLFPSLSSTDTSMTYFDIWRHLSSAKIRIGQNNIAATRQQLDPPTWRPPLPLQSTREERKEATE
jgi:hypothetical protein